MLASERDGEVIAAARAIVRTATSNGGDIQVLAEHIERMNGGSGLSGTRSRSFASAAIVD
jgi:hypothetical protein